MSTPEMAGHRFVVGGAGLETVALGSIDTGGGIGEGNLTLERMGLGDNIAHGPELFVNEASPTLTPYEDEEDRYPASISDPYSDSFDTTSSTSPTISPIRARARASTTSEGSSNTRPSGLVALARLNSSTSLQTPTLAHEALATPLASTYSPASRPTSRSGSVNSQQYPDSLHPASASASSSRKNTLNAPDSSPSYFSPRSLKKSRSSSGIAGALALSGVALASPSAQLRQPVSLMRGSSSKYGLSKRDSSSQDRDGADSDRGSTYGGNGGEGLMSMDSMGDFDQVVNQLGTGYAVASSKRNAEFHAIFKNIPDDDYLIEGEPMICVLGESQLNPFLLVERRLWLRDAEGDIDPGTAVYFGASPVVQCEYLWLGHFGA